MRVAATAPAAATELAAGAASVHATAAETLRTSAAVRATAAHAAHVLPLYVQAALPLCAPASAAATATAHTATENREWPFLRPITPWGVCLFFCPSKPAPGGPKILWLLMRAHSHTPQSIFVAAIAAYLW